MAPINVPNGTCKITCDNGYVLNSAGTGCEKIVCNDGNKKCDAKTYMTCSNNRWTSTPCTAPTNGTASCSATTGCSWSCNSNYLLCGSSCLGSSGTSGFTQEAEQLYTGAGTGASGTTSKYGSYNIHGASGSYYAINNNGIKRYIAKSKMFIFPAKGKVTASKGILIRPCSSTSCNNSIDYNGVNGAILTVLGYTDGDDGNGWYKVNCIATNVCTTGYATAQYIELTSGTDKSFTTCSP